LLPQEQSTTGSGSLSAYHSVNAGKKGHMGISVKHQSSSNGSYKQAALWHLNHTKWQDLTQMIIANSIEFTCRFVRGTRATSLTLTSFSESPLHLLMMLLALMLKKVVRHSVATALASRVLPVPGGPYSSRPFQGLSRPAEHQATRSREVRIYGIHI
jgi:hypothetical protein